MSPAAPSTDLVVASTQELAEIMDTPELQMLWKRATLYSSGNMLQKDLRGRPADDDDRLRGVEVGVGSAQRTR